jgi:hypothetical protein
MPKFRPCVKKRATMTTDMIADETKLTVRQRMKRTLLFSGQSLRRRI